MRQRTDTLADDVFSFGDAEGELYLLKPTQIVVKVLLAANLEAQ